jgi:hypothetical protein
MKVHASFNFGGSTGLVSLQRHEEDGGSSSDDSVEGASTTVVELTLPLGAAGAPADAEEDAVLIDTDEDDDDMDNEGAASTVHLLAAQVRQPPSRDHHPYCRLHARRGAPVWSTSLPQCAACIMCRIAERAADSAWACRGTRVAVSPAAMVHSRVEQSTAIYVKKARSCELQNPGGGVLWCFVKHRSVDSLNARTQCIPPHPPRYR